MKKPYTPILPTDQFMRALAVARVFRIPIILLGILPFPFGLPRSAHRNRRRGRA